MLKLFLTLIISLFIFVQPAFAQTKSWSQIQASIGATCYDKSSGTEVATLQGFACIFANILRLIIPLSGLAAFVTLIAGGFQFLTAAGDPKKIQQATAVITAAVIGIVVVLGIWLIFTLLNQLTGLNLLQFTMPSTPNSLPCVPCGTGTCCNGVCVGGACRY